MAIPADIVAAVAARLAEHAGLDVPAWVVEARAAARMAALELAPADYVALLGGARGGRGAAELDELIEQVRVGETRLFRHRPQIAALADAVIPALRGAGRRAIRVWSAGCAAGQEPYTLAAVLARGLPGAAISIVATDVSAEALEAARAASYPAAAWADVPAAFRDAFVQDEDRVRVRPEIAALVRFQRANLVDGHAPRGCDLVWCRNVLIYFTPAARRAAQQRLLAALGPGGFLFVGYSETLRDVPELLAVRTASAVYYVRREPDAAERRRPTTGELGGPGASAAPVAPAAQAAQAAPGPLGAQAARIARGGRRPTPPGGVPEPIPAAGTAPGRSPLELGADPTPPPARSSQDLSPRPVTGPGDRLAGADAGRAGTNPGSLRAPQDPGSLRAPQEPPPHDVLALRGQPDARSLVADITARLAMAGLVQLAIDLDGCELLGDDLAPVLRRARAAAAAAGIELSLRTTRAGARRWLARHGLAEAAP